MADIFLSYANEDREVARAVAGLLESAGCTVWWDRRIPAGRTWRSMIEEALRDMRCMVVLWSSHSVDSDWVKEEAEEARALGRLVPVLIEPVKPPVGFRSIQAADLTDWDGSTDSLGARVAVRYRETDGYVDNLTLDRKEPSREELAGRLTFTWSNSEAFDATLRLEGGRTRWNRVGTSLRPPRSGRATNSNCGRARKCRAGRQSGSGHCSARRGRVFCECFRYAPPG